ncbi:4a-hydroxytetrahydrobiopterin dehydratase [Nocardiopsis prasina]|uniref:4a-hydroxytetrahydrobiopterin dehydratase n=1 Tax=Nocardiopsis prasina TaxID=2015 RepID=UPI00034BFB22|nr:4a-hydroxytetrahydrobiopterin dehydratase [Nocardiopsis prasina]
MAVLSEEEIRDGLGRLVGWEWDTEGAAIRRSVRLVGFLEAVSLVNEVAQAAEQAGHHPDIDIRYDTVSLALSTHDEGGVTEKDMALAARVNELVEGTARVAE